MSIIKYKYSIAVATFMVVALLCGYLRSSEYKATGAAGPNCFYNCPIEKEELNKASHDAHDIILSHHLPSSGAAYSGDHSGAGNKGEPGHSLIATFGQCTLCSKAIIKIRQWLIKASGIVYEQVLALFPKHWFW